MQWVCYNISKYMSDREQVHLDSFMSYNSSETIF